MEQITPSLDELFGTIRHQTGDQIQLPSMIRHQDKVQIDPQIIQVDPQILNKIETKDKATIRNVDVLFTFFHNLRIDVIRSLVDKPEHFLKNMWGSDYGLSRDIYCRVNMGRSIPSLKSRVEDGAMLSTSTRKMCCQGCHNIKVLTNYRQARQGQFRCQWGNFKNQSFTLLRRPMVGSSIWQYQQPLKLLSSIQASHPLAQACQRNLPSLKTARFYGLDSFSNYVLINWYLQSVLAKSNMPHIRKLHYSFVCGQDGYLLLDCQYDNSSNLIKFRMEHNSEIWSLLFQLFALFHRIRTYNLSFTNITPETLLIKNQPCQYNYDDLDIASNFTLIINDLSESGISVAAKDDPDSLVRIFANPTIGERSQRYQFDRDFDWVKITDEKYQTVEDGCNSYVAYKISDQDGKGHNNCRFKYVNRLGLPLYNGSLDIYRILMVLSQNDGFFESINNNHSLNAIWRTFWIPDQYQMIMDRLMKCRQSKLIFDPTRALYGLYLRCDMVNHGWNMLKTEARRRTTREEIIVEEMDQDIKLRIQSP